MAGFEETGQAHVVQRDVKAAVVPRVDIAQTLEHRPVEHREAARYVSGRIGIPGTRFMQGRHRPQPEITRKREFADDRDAAWRDYGCTVTTCLLIEHFGAHLDIQHAFVERDPIEGTN